MNYFVHSSSLVDAGVIIGKNSKIWHFCHILSGVKIGENCSFGQNCVIGPHVEIGNGCKVQNNVSIHEGVECKDNVFLGPSVVFTNVYNPRAFISRKDQYKKTLLKTGCSIGANATIVCGVSIGEYALVGAGSLVREDIKAFALVVGVPAKQIGWVDKGGCKMIFDPQGIAIDSYDKSRYKLQNNQVVIDED
ncbi:acyltransferase [Helicobacter sp. 11S03491-1]|uniref:acyltransferase n=1 Tax=Helicobacter sp. 11S03491-1 TaxID=1476196 RepID=UPI000BA6039C|nr:acyltransferase [Helicobacter sp. 11S03491-1]PAF43799.1 N-acetyltransferase [Helicobacter sp. 11S03491-1]